MNRFWKAGIAVVDITPPVGIDLAGYVAREQGSIGVHDGLYAKALVLHDGVERAAVLTCDLLGVDAEDVRFVRRQIEERTGIPAGNIMIAASHTHSGPATLHTNGIGKRDEEWMKTLFDKMPMCAESAVRTLEEVTVRTARGTAEIGINRRGKIPEGEINPLPDPSGPVDREVSVICVDRVSTGKPWVVLFNYGCHPTVLGAENRLVSSDYVGAAVQFVERALGNGTVAMFTNGGAGNVNPISTGSFDIRQLLGERLGASVVELVHRQGAQLEPFLRILPVTVNVPFGHVPSVAEVQELVRRYTNEATRSGAMSVPRKIADACLVWAKDLEDDVRKGDITMELPIEVQRFNLGDFFLAALPAEVFAETVLSLKRAFQGRIIVASYANGNVGYLPTREEIPKGGYEVLEAHKYYGYPAHFGAEGEERLRGALVGRAG